MKKRKIIPFIAVSLLTMTSCGGSKIDRVDDERTLTEGEYTVNNLSCVDSLGRNLELADERNNDRKIGLFYHVWHGYHNTACDDIGSTYNITNLLKDDPTTLADASIHANDFHYWGEPLYGYYNSSDPWVITRHIELLTNAGVDYLAYDLTNSVIYTSAINAMFKELDKYQKQGFNVPKVVFYTHTGSAGVINSCYNTWYKANKYSNLWYSKDGKKPLIIGVKGEVEKLENGSELLDFFDVEDCVWPTDSRKDYEGFPWMDWGYPQDNYSGTMVVSLAQHPGMRMSDQAETNNGRGFDYSTFQNDSSKVNEGSNFKGQYETVFEANKLAEEKNDKDYEVNNVFITGFNEWIAQKLHDGANRVFFVDTFNEEYSRDIEMCKDGYGDNYYLELMELNREYAWTTGKHYKLAENTIDINDSSLSGWSKVKTNFKDFSGDALERDFLSANQRTKNTDTSNRNDIVKTSVTHDADNLYIKVETAQNLTDRSASDKAYMNIMLNTKKNSDNFAGFDYVVNRSLSGNQCSIERLKADYKTEEVGKAQITTKDNVMQVSIPLSTLGLNRDECNVSIKVTDNVQNQNDPLDYYVSGDSAPIGRLGYDYGY